MKDLIKGVAGKSFEKMTMTYRLELLASLWFTVSLLQVRIGATALKSMFSEGMVEVPVKWVEIFHHPLIAMILLIVVEVATRYIGQKYCAKGKYSDERFEKSQPIVMTINDISEVGLAIYLIATSILITTGKFNIDAAFPIQYKIMILLSGGWFAIQMIGLYLRKNDEIVREVLKKNNLSNERVMKRPDTDKC